MLNFKQTIQPMNHGGNTDKMSSLAANNILRYRTCTCSKRYSNEMVTRTFGHDLPEPTGTFVTTSFPLFLPICKLGNAAPNI